MRTLEDTLAPPRQAIVWLDLLSLVPLAAITALLLPYWAAADDAYVTDVAGQVASPYLLAALGMMLALRTGVLDLSVWMAVSAGALVAAGLIHAGAAAWAAFGLAVLAGALIGLLNGAGVVVRRWPSLTVTAATAMFVFVLLQAIVPAGEVPLPDDAFKDWLIPARTQPTAAEDAEIISFPLGVTRSFIIAAIFSAVMALLLTHRSGAPHTGRQRWVVLVLAGGLAALAGACALIDHGCAYRPRLPFDDLRIPAAVLLAGGAALAGPGRTLIAGFCLPIAMLAATMWRQMVWPLGYFGIEWQVVVLVVLALLITLAVRHLRTGRAGKPLAAGGYGLALLGMLLLAWGGLAGSAGARSVFRWAALPTALAAAALLLLLAAQRRHRRHPAHAHQA